ncbi:hypothetical protein A3D07_00660 [Candidatus Curtissbacteria bacterium RIFCSPHIGHO2_02_FULL_42_15]|uniref:Glutamine amidotransferase domain-containing protein n=1 Tax=Candidatus Curtissbacteria bacterium RIFCSPHIGHO2_02_FULL_42_15 TaxID=1797716 RepID=A0A1F5GG28_9BACT|nr:MAG: hypothetical protein A3D07_00660 [Candidatus Curtissbacteria bacterium RIFCSPHIGHO2_02_FULL_42_15]
MNKTVLIIKNITREGPGLIEKILQENLIYYDVVDLSTDERAPDSKNYGTLIVLGGPDSANDKTPKIKNEIKFIKNWIAAKKSFLGICLGLQLLVKAAGGKVIKSRTKEVGFRDPEGNLFEVELLKNSQKDPLLYKLGKKIRVFHLHGETVTLTKKMQVLGKGKYCQNQIVKVADRAYGLQGHFELTERMLDIWLSEDPELKRLDAKKVRADFDEIKEEYERTANQIFTNFLKIAKLI